MTAQLIDGTTIAANLRAKVAAYAADILDRHGVVPGLAVVLVGNNPASQVYVRSKIKMTKEAGLYSIEHMRPETATQAELLAVVATLNADPSVDGILVQLPLPAQIDADAVIAAIDPAKDVDGFHPYNLGRLAQREPLLRPCTPYGVMKMLQAVGIDPAGMDAVIVGQSNIVGRPMSLELAIAGATVTTCHSRTRDLPTHIARADLVVAAIGKPNFVRGEWIKPGAVVIDVGINRLADGKLCGDVEFAAARTRAGWITPVPGGAGPMTVAMLMQNTLEAYGRH